MAEQKKRKSTRTRTTARRTQSASRSRAPSSSSPGGNDQGPAAFESQIGSLIGSITDLTSDLTSTALKLATRTRESASRAIRRTPEQLRMMASAGESLRDMREVAGMTVLEITDALNLKDKSIWEAVEDGREVLSFELILRLASLVARNDPLPFVLKYTRTYHPRLWEVLHELKIDQLPIQFERERSFINIYRRHDTARKLSDPGFERVLKFTQQAFEMAIHFVAEQEHVRPEEDGEGRPRRGAGAGRRARR